MGFLKDFRDFAVKGNVMDLAVGVIIGGAFGKIVSSLVNDIFMPVIGLITGKGFKDMKLVLKDAVMAADGKEEVAAVTMNYGTFIQNTIDFVIIAFVIFMMVRMISSLKKQEAAAPPPPPGPTKEEVLLTEIRDLLKNR